MKLLLITLICTNAIGGQWKVNPKRSSIHIDLKKDAATAVTGTLTDISGLLTMTGDDIATAKLVLHGESNKLTTGNPMQDQLLKSNLLLDVQKYPKIDFESTRFVKSSGNTFSIRGKLSARGLVREVELKATGFLKGRKIFKARASMPLNDPQVAALANSLQIALGVETYENESR